MLNTDFTELSAEDLDTVRVALTNECERRQRLASAADTVAAIAERFVADGGDSADLVAAVESVTPVEPVEEE